MTTTFHTFRDLPVDARAFWEDVGRAQDPAGYFTASPEWTELMAGDGPDAASVAVTRAADDRPLAVFPMLPRPWQLDARVLGRSLNRRSLQTLKIGGGDLLARELHTDGLAAALAAILERHPAADALWFEHVGDAAREEALARAARRSAQLFPVVLFRNLPQCRLALPPTLDEALALRSGKSHQRLRAKEKALARDAGQAVQVVEICTPEEWAPYEARIERLVNQSWQAQLLGHAFRLDSVRGTAQRGWMRSFLLLAGEEPLAYTLYYEGMGTLVSALLAYDRRYARHSPGAILFQHTLRKLYARNPPQFLDFGEGDADYKRQWSNRETHVSSLLLVRRRVGLRARLTLYRAARAADRAGRGLLKAAGIDRLLARRAKMAAGHGEEDG